MYQGTEEVLACLSDKKPRSLEAIASSTGLHIDSVRRIIEDLKNSGHVELTGSSSETLVASDEFSGYYKQRMLPEFSIFKKASEGAPLSALTGEDKSIGLQWARQKGYIKIDQGKLLCAKSKTDVEKDLQALIQAFEYISASKPLSNPPMLEELLRRKLVTKKIQKQLLVSATGKKLEASSSFDISVPTADAEIGKPHPVSVLTERIKTIFTELGFEEMRGDIVQSSFWNFDALFQPQDHPARDLADTFYLKGESELPDAALAKRVSEAHEKSWKYKWNPADAKKKVLRTHTTSVSARYLAALKGKEPKKYFSVGKVFRNEATDFKHLTEFYQVEGIISWEKATFSDLLGILKEFYCKLGFENIRFRPSYFPYTEPSLEIEVYFEPRKEWLELGGAGIFRPEVSMPLCGSYPVLAWGLSLERPLLLLLGLNDIRTFYRNDLDFLRSTRLDI